MRLAHWWWLVNLKPNSVWIQWKLWRDLIGIFVWDFNCKLTTNRTPRPRCARQKCAERECGDHRHRTKSDRTVISTTLTVTVWLMFPRFVKVTSYPSWFFGAFHCSQYATLTKYCLFITIEIWLKQYQKRLFRIKMVNVYCFIGEIRTLISLDILTFLEEK